MAMAPIQFGEILNYVSYGEPTRSQLAEATYILDAEYRGCGVNIDNSNISDKIKSTITKNRLKIFGLFINIVKNVIDTENSLYVRPPVRYFVTKKGDPVSDKIQDRINDIYEQLDMNTFMLQTSRQAAYEGTVLAMPMWDERFKEMFWAKLTPSDVRVNIKSDINIASRAQEVMYEIEKNERGNKEEHTWDYDDHIIVEHVDGQKLTTTLPHLFKTGQPWAPLRYLTDHSRFWGPYDGTLESLVKTRSLLLADAVHRTQTSLYEILVMAGFTPEEALAATRTIRATGAVVYENDKDSDGNPIPNSKKIEYASPTGIAPDMVLQVLMAIYKFFLNARGHTSKDLESSRINQTAEAQRLASMALQDLQESRKPYLAAYEQELYTRIVWMNNQQSGVPKLPFESRVNVDWQPDNRFFNDASDKVNYFDFSLKNDIMTGPDVVRAENPELSKEAAEEVYLENIKFNEAHITVIEPLQMNGDDDNNNGNGQADQKDE